MQEYTKVFVENKLLFNKNKNSDKNISGLTKRFSKLRKSFSSRDSVVGLLSSEINNYYQDSINENKLQSSDNIFARIKLVVNRFSGTGSGRSRHSEAYHQDGKTNPFE
ncbi:3622_t:CDS:1 [Funneliformis caledonium]|uniref:3622_t:CDS:1 n=1 Tax=Funneliformis caledonium TaxID=1117310 RepID=A0A9N9NEX1_9GLOM|nr:3622_t:CDS:1 [Funneliformis caledonium]